jgi:hypothetical protein
MLNFFDARDWQKYGIGLAASRHLDETEMAFLSQSLQEALRAKVTSFAKAALTCQEECVFRKDVKYPPIAIMASKSHPTYHKAILDGPKSTYGLDIETPAKIPGDGTVPWIDAQPPSCTPTILSDPNQQG